MNESDLRDLLPAERLLPAARRRDMKERLMVQINDEVRTSRRRYRLLAGALAAALLVIAGAVAVLASTKGDNVENPPSGPDRETMTTTAPPPPGSGEDGTPAGGGRTVPVPAEADQAVANLDDAGRLLRLDADGVLCVDGEHVGWVTADTSANAYVLDLAFDDLLTEQLLVDECVSGTWAVDIPPYQTDAFREEEATACVREGGYGPTNSTGNDGFLLPVVVLNNLSCDEVGADNSRVREITDDDLAEINRMRAIEVALLANPDSCPTLEHATVRAEDILAQEGIDLEGQVWTMESDTAPPDCPFQPNVVWHASGFDGATSFYGLQVTVQYYGG